MSKNDVISRVMATIEARGEIYGPPHKDFERTAKLWSAYLGVEVRPEQVTACMMLLKISRLAETPDHDDSLLDIAGYVHCYEDCIKNGRP